jgi:hypothetical protein
MDDVVACVTINGTTRACRLPIDGGVQDLDLDLDENPR